MTFADEALYHGFKIEGAHKKLIGTLHETKCIRPLLMKSSSAEVKAAVLCELGMKKDFWDEYYPDIAND